MPELLLGIDVGTHSTKGVLTKPIGEILATPVNLNGWLTAAKRGVTANTDCTALYNDRYADFIVLYQQTESTVHRLNGGAS